MRRKFRENMAIAPAQEKVRTGFHSYWRLGDWAEAHGRRHSSREAAETEDLATFAVALQVAARHMAKHSLAMAAARGAAQDAGSVDAGIEVAAAVAAAVLPAAVGMAQAREPASAAVATWRKTWRGLLERATATSGGLL